MNVSFPPIPSIQQLDGFMQTLRRKVCVTLRGRDVGVAQQLLDFVDAHTRIDQSAGKTMAQVVQANIVQVCISPHAVNGGAILGHGSGTVVVSRAA